MFVEFQDLFLGMTAGEHYTKNTLFELLKTIGHPDIEALDADTVFNVMKLSKSIRVFKPTGGRYRTVYVAVKLPVDPTVTGMTGITGSGEACPSSLLEGTDATGTTSPDEANPSTPPRGPTVSAATSPPSKYVLALMKDLQRPGKEPSSEGVSQLALEDTNFLVNSEVGLKLAEAGMTIGSPSTLAMAITTGIQYQFLHVVVRSPKQKRMLSPPEDAESQVAKKVKASAFVVAGTGDERRVVQVKVLHKFGESALCQSEDGTQGKVSLTDLFDDVVSAEQFIKQEKEKVKSAEEWQKQDNVSLSLSGTLLATTLGVLRTEPQSVLCNMFTPESLKNFTKDPQGNYFLAEQPIPFHNMIEILQGHQVEMDEMLRSQVQTLANKYGLKTVLQRLQENTPTYFC